MQNFKNMNFFQKLMTIIITLALLPILFWGVVILVGVLVFVFVVIVGLSVLLIPPALLYLIIKKSIN